MQHIVEAIEHGATGDDLADLPIPEEYRAAHVLKAEQDMWAGVAVGRQGPAPEPARRRRCRRRELAPDEAYIAVMASSINFNTVWTQHLRAGQHVRPAGPPRPARASGRSATTSRTRWSAATPPVSCCRSARRCATGSRAIA